MCVHTLYYFTKHGDLGLASSDRAYRFQLRAKLKVMMSSGRPMLSPSWPGKLKQLSGHFGFEEVRVYFGKHT